MRVPIRKVAQAERHRRIATSLVDRLHKGEIESLLALTAAGDET